LGRRAEQRVYAGCGGDGGVCCYAGDGHVGTKSGGGGEQGKEVRGGRDSRAGRRDLTEKRHILPVGNGAEQKGRKGEDVSIVLRAWQVGSTVFAQNGPELVAMRTRNCTL
jgi:hypothetical protein